MQLAGLLARDGLTPDVRILIGTAVSIWHADWPNVTAWIQLAKQLHELSVRTEGQVSDQHERQHACQREDFEETLLQCVLFCGFPRVITAFEHLCDAWPAEQAPSGGGLPVDKRESAGNELFHSIYGKNDAAVRSMLRGYHQELHDFVLEAAYSRILTRPQLSAKKRELIAVAVLAAQGQKRQFAGHARGAKHLGASAEELREALVTTFGSEAEGTADVEHWMSLVR
ncbi:MAG: alkylhydroperoxidase/carboxymuconolactone decarboxylase family protein YurZ [Hyphomicrobiaceae bacterium]|jgi:alkylhydroperoxidase/carboxymuconolactone decarboxylase family protein YurZ